MLGARREIRPSFLCFLAVVPRHWSASQKARARHRQLDGAWRQHPGGEGVKNQRSQLDSFPFFDSWRPTFVSPKYMPRWHEAPSPATPGRSCRQNPEMWYRLRDRTQGLPGGKERGDGVLQASGWTCPRCCIQGG